VFVSLFPLGVSCICLLNFLFTWFLPLTPSRSSTAHLYSGDLDCCRTNDLNGTRLAGPFGDYVCDLPLHTAEHMLEYITSKMDAPVDLVLWTGGVWSLCYFLLGSVIDLSCCHECPLLAFFVFSCHFLSLYTQHISTVIC